MAPKKINKFDFVPSQRASGGIFMGWCGAIFSDETIFKSRFAITVKFTAMLNAETWTLTTVYGPCTELERQDFINWLNGLNIDDNCNWMFVGDFNFYRSLEDRNWEGGNMQNIIVFNEMISNLGLQEIPLKGRSFTWSNMQEKPLLEQIDWCFTSVNWIYDYPNTLMLPLAKTTSDHVPCMIQIGTSTSKAKVFRFENLWLDQASFLDVFKSVWSRDFRANNSASKVAAKLKELNRTLKKWAKGLSKLKEQIKVCNSTLLVLDELENRPLNPPERNFRNILKRFI
jgi:hypothetical protein